MNWCWGEILGPKLRPRIFIPKMGWDVWRTLSWRRLEGAQATYLRGADIPNQQLRLKVTIFPSWACPKTLVPIPASWFLESCHVPHVCQKVAPKSSIYGQNPLNFAQIHLACDLLRQVWAGRQWQDLASRDIYPEVAAASPIIHPIITVSDMGPNLGWKRKMEQKLSMASNTSRTLRAGLIGHMANWSDFKPTGPTGPTARNPAKHPKNHGRFLHKYPIWVVPYWVLVRPSPSASTGALGAVPERRAALHASGVASPSIRRSTDGSSPKWVWVKIRYPKIMDG